jgi:hypothetical protein
MVTVLTGELSFTYQGATPLYREGESFVEAPGVLAQARNASAAPTRVMVSYLLPAGAPLSEPQAAPDAAQQSDTMPATLPNTGDPHSTSVGWLIALAGVGLFLCGVWLRRRLARR